MSNVPWSRLGPPSYFVRPLAGVAPRDLLLLQFLQPRPTDVALEIGIGSGSSLFRLANSVAALHSLDISAQTVERLRPFLSKGGRRLRDVQLFVADFCQADAPAQLPIRYDLIYSCDTLEHVVDPGTFLANVCQALSPGGRAFIAFPNEHPTRAHGITFFERRDMLVGLMQTAGFAADQVQIENFQMMPRAQRVFELGWHIPRRLIKEGMALARRWGRFAEPFPATSLEQPVPALATEEPQSFDQTDFFSVAHHLEPLAPLINAYCWAIMRLMASTGRVYKLFQAPEILWDTQILMRATRDT
jgi:SAM-dependent methyltransferase